MRHLTAALSLALVVQSFLAAQSVPTEVAALTARAGVSSPVVGWCRGEFRPGNSGSFAVAVSSAAGGRYLVVEANATSVELGSYIDSADLACYTPAEARTLHLAIEQSDTIQGEIAPQWGTTVVCGFVDATTSVCWQYSPNDRKFVRVGGWVT